MKKFEHALNLSDLPLTKMEPDEYVEVEAQEVTEEEQQWERLLAYNQQDVETEALLRKVASRITPFPPKVVAVSNPRRTDGIRLISEQIGEGVTIYHGRGFYERK